MNFLNSAAATPLGRVLLSGAVVNFVLVILGSLLGLLFKKGIPEKVRTTLMNGMALCVIYIGVTGLFEENTNIIIIILSFAVGAVIGELTDLDRRINLLGEKIEAKFNKNGTNTKIADGFVTATLLFCVGNTHNTCERAVEILRRSCVAVVPRNLVCGSVDKRKCHINGRFGHCITVVLHEFNTEFCAADNHHAFL